MDSKTRAELTAKIKSKFKEYKIDDYNLPVTWADKVDQIVPAIPTPSARLNTCLGVGGIPLGRIVEIYGNESAGKTTLMLEIIAKAQKMGLPTAFVDMEHALDPTYASNLDVNMDDLFITQPDTGNAALQVMKVLIESGFKLIVLDSIPALVSRDEYDKEVTDNNMALQARMMGQTIRQLSPMASRAGCALVFINQIREKIGVMWGNPETTPGGRAIKFFASVRIEMRALSKKDEQRRTSKITIVKNKLAPPFKSCEIDIVFGKGFDKLSDTIQYAKELGIISGRSWMTLPKFELDNSVEYPEDLKFQGLDSVTNFIESTPGYCEALMEECQRVSKLDRTVEQIEKIEELPI